MMQLKYPNNTPDNFICDAVFIDKTPPLESELARFPSVYMEGAAASGKSVAVRMLLEKKVFEQSVVFLMGDEVRDVADFEKKMLLLRTKWANAERSKVYLVVFEDISCVEDAGVLEKIADFILHMPKGFKVILTGRERPQESFLELLWKHKMELMSQRSLLLDKEDVRMMAEQQVSSLHPDDVYEKTGGWAGCVAMILRLAAHQVYSEDMWKADDYLKCYEMETYIQRQILETLSQEEKEMMSISGICPWLSESLCREVWRLEDPLPVLQSLERKGLLIKNYKKGHWIIAPMFRIFYENPRNRRKTHSSSWKYLGIWYEGCGFIKEAIECFRLAEDEELLRRCMEAHYDQIPFLGISWDEVMEWKESQPSLIYLRGMYFYRKKNFKDLEKEIARLDVLDEKSRESDEIRLNLLYVMPGISMEQWLDVLKQLEGSNYRLFGFLGDSSSILCGLRDLTELYACTRNEEKKRERIWKEKLDRDAQTAYVAAKIEYFLEIARESELQEEDRIFLLELLKIEGVQNLAVKEDFCLGALHILCKWQRIEEHPKIETSIQKACEFLMKEARKITANNAEAVHTWYSLRNGKKENLLRWMHYNHDEYPLNVGEENYVMLFFQAKGYILHNQYEKAERMLTALIPYFQLYHKSLLLAEALFLKAIAAKGKGKKTSMLRSVIESFVVCGNNRYVRIYTQYGRKGKEVLEEYVEWMKNNAPGGWHRKKKYNYGNVLRMPLEDYLETILRMAKKEVKNYIGMEELEQEEHLTGMETVLLLHLSQGMSNAEICKELNLKMSTVKTHLYSLYKKMGVNSRTQAVVRGKELGVVK